MTQRNVQGQPIGPPVTDWQGCPPIGRLPMSGRYCDVIPLELSHAPDLFAAYGADQTGTLWTYMSVGPFADEVTFTAWLASACASEDQLFFAIVDKATDKAVGVASFLRMQPEMGVAEVGNITFSPLLQRTAMATEAMYLMMKYLLDDLGYRRYEWKCDALNAPSRAAAQRLGFQFEGIFRQALVYKGRNRDTAWFSIIDSDWPRIRAAFEAWLEPQNFAEDNRQRQPLQARRP